MSKVYCEKCGGFIEWNFSSRLLSYPPKYKGKCKDCGEVYYEFCHKFMENTNERD